MVSFGILYVNVIGYFGSFSWLSVAVIFVCLIWSMLLLRIPESPEYLVTTGNREQAKQALRVSFISLL